MLALFLHNITQRFALSAICLLLVSWSVNANSLLSGYEQNLADKTTGIYPLNDKLYFVVKQPCLTNKKFAGSAESKAAEQHFYQLLMTKIAKINIAENEDKISLDSPLKEAIFAQFNKTQLQSIPHQLLLDRNNQSQHCERIYVKVADQDDFIAKRFTLTESEVLAISGELLLAAIKNQDYALAAEYLTNLGLIDLSDIYQVLQGNTELHVNITSADPVSKCVNITDNTACQFQTQRYSKYDVHFVLANILNQPNYHKVINQHPNPALAEPFFAAAQVNFKLGQNPQQIIDDLTLAINSQPSHRPAWQMLSSVYRATGQEKLAQLAATQLILQAPQDMEAWVYYLKSYPAQSITATLLQPLLNAVSHKITLSTWARQQLKVNK